MTSSQAAGFDNFGKGGGLVDGNLVREFPVPRKSARRHAA
jgi:hypothetical protein